MSPIHLLIYHHNAWPRPDPRNNPSQTTLSGLLRRRAIDPARFTRSIIRSNMRAHTYNLQPQGGQAVTTPLPGHRCLILVGRISLQFLPSSSTHSTILVESMSIRFYRLI
ncbi:hypothetical protein MJO29_005945 [Puccinia striiformis f. sp. tritici]|nr:hypothetical protein MJO29_005945 [Puccinia striiformis f. sp. tritici]